MSFKKSIKKISVVALLALTASPVCGQDLLARQAPVDHRMKSLDTLAVSHYRMIEDRENPAAELYEDFSNKYAHRATTLPEHYRIDLRHFCMPTPSRVVTSNFGYRASFGRQHKGMDIKVYIGDSIRSAFSGRVRIVRYEGAKSLGGFGALGSLFPSVWDWHAFWLMTAFLSIILAFMNILPIPALDGGHVFFLLYEIITGRKPGDKFMERAEYIGFGILILLLVVANLNDVLRVFGIL
jgi:hypothetical protein